jgi:chromosome segregation ATPase
MPPDNNILQFHERRINSLEEEHTDLAKQLSQHGERIDYLADRVDETRQQLGDKLDKIDAKLDVHEDHARKFDGRLGKLEDGAAKLSAVKKSLLALVIASAGIVGKELLMLALHYFTH